MTVLERIALPVVQAPMAGGLSTVDLAAAVSSAGGFGFLAAGYRSAADLEQDITELRRRMSEPFGVNVFVPPREPTDPEVYAKYLRQLHSTAAAYGVELGEPRFHDDDWDAKLEVLERARVPVVSLVFGCPPAGVIAALRATGAEVWVTVTNLAEARLAAETGADGLVAQGYEAGAHRATFDRASDDPLGVLALLQLLAGETALPLVAAGGIATGAAIAAVLSAGAAAAQLGTAFLRCPEAGTAPVHRDALASERPTRLTRAFTGRLARGIVNDFIERHDAEAPSAYPEVHYATAPLRAAARARGDDENLHLWAGQTHQLAAAVPARRLVKQLAADASAAAETSRRRLTRHPDDRGTEVGNLSGGDRSSHGAPAPGALSRPQARAFAARWLPAWSGNQPERLIAFYADDAFYRDPAVPGGVNGREELLAYFRRLLARFPDWQWRQRDATPMEGGFLNHWEATIPLPNSRKAVTCAGVCSVELRAGLICRNEVFFDRTPLLTALAD